ncbi:hypothetical protein FDG2_0402 [Candidatus Protofrankia californiensis]|uniref:Uncharacterized protein n=1 Tax=Candidatus Protofrankia californiensis TaxID=1839754 RepID=A0A1C3NTG7_9ACTN|nr:hypothetical protein FDG2_0402 [Candidatus Protofrankia californiensis]
MRPSPGITRSTGIARRTLPSHSGTKTVDDYPFPVKTMGGSGLLCPKALPPAHPVHAVHTQTVIAVSKAAERDSDGELTPTGKAVHKAATNGFNSDRMRLYMASTSAIVSGQAIMVSTCWWQCHLCGLILPATATPFGPL